MKIAVIIDEAGELVNRCENSRVCLYEKGLAGWTLEKQLRLDVPQGTGLPEAKRRLKGIFCQLDGCEVFLLRELRGLLFVLLQEMGFRIWKSDGALAEQLDQVVLKEAEVATVVLKPLPAPVPIGTAGDGRFRINLAEALENDPSLNSKQILIPVLEKFAFQKLEIICDHLPRWFPQECERLKLLTESESPNTAGRGIRVVVLPKRREVSPS